MKAAALLLDEMSSTLESRNTLIMQSSRANGGGGPAAAHIFIYCISLKSRDILAETAAPSKPTSNKPARDSATHC